MSRENRRKFRPSTGLERDKSVSTKSFAMISPLCFRIFRITFQEFREKRNHWSRRNMEINRLLYPFIPFIIFFIDFSNKESNIIFIPIINHELLKIYKIISKEEKK